MPGTEVFYMPINTSVAPFTDIKVREAVALAVNQKEIQMSLFGGLGAVANNFLVSSLQESKINPKFNISYNPERAKKLLDEAGWAVGSGGIRAKAGTPLTVKLWTQNGTQFKRVTEVIQAQLKAIGVNAEITVQDPASINAMYKKEDRSPTGGAGLRLHERRHPGLVLQRHPARLPERVDVERPQGRGAQRQGDEGFAHLGGAGGQLQGLP